MLRAWGLAGCMAAMLACVPAPSRGASPEAGLIVVGTDGAEHILDPAGLDALPMVTVVQGEGGRRFEGPLLWTVLDRATAMGAPRIHDQVRQTVLLTGRDGYTAILALGEIAPEFENKQVILAERMDEQPLGPGHLRIVVPGDKRGGRGVHDVVRITVTALPR